MKIAIIYTSKYGTAEKIASAIRHDLKTSNEIELFNLTNCTPPPAENYDVVILGSSVYAGKLRPEMAKFCANRKNEICESKAELHLFLCGMDLEKAEIQKDLFGEELKQRAKTVRFIPGEYHLEKMNIFERLLLRIFFKVKENLERDYTGLVKNFLDGDAK